MKCNSMIAEADFSGWMFAQSPGPLRSSIHLRRLADQLPRSRRPAARVEESLNFQEQIEEGEPLD
jgi:hypothetical protein